MLICNHCHRPIIPDWETYTISSSGEVTHTSHAPKTSTILLILAVVLILAIAALARGDPGDVKGCICTYHSQSGKFTFEPFIKTADKASASEDGQPEVWGFKPWDLGEPDKTGKVYPVNVLASRFIPLNTFKEVPAGTTTRRVKCPPYWSGD